MIELLPCEVELPSWWAGDPESGQAFTSVPKDSRRFTRRDFRSCAALEYRETFPSFRRPQTRHRIYMINVARGGISFLHGEELFPRERMRVVLRDGCDRLIEIVRCRRVQDQCFEVGARFVEERDTAQHDQR